MSRDLTAALAALTEPSAEKKGLPEAPLRGAKPAAKSAKIFSKPGGGGGDLTETAFADREYHLTPWKTSDGLFEFPALKAVHFVDGQGNAVVHTYQAPI